MKEETMSGTASRITLFVVALALIAASIFVLTVGAKNASAEASEEIVVTDTGYAEVEYAKAYEEFCLVNDCSELGAHIPIPGNTPVPKGPGGGKEPKDIPCEDEWESYATANATYQKWADQRERAGHSESVKPVTFGSDETPKTTNGQLLNLSSSYSPSTGLVQYRFIVVEDGLVSTRGSYLHDRADDALEAYMDCMTA